MSKVLFYTILALNLVSDCCILMIPIPVSDIIAHRRRVLTLGRSLYP